MTSDVQQIPGSKVPFAVSCLAIVLFTVSAAHSQVEPGGGADLIFQDNPLESAFQQPQDSYLSGKTPESGSTIADREEAAEACDSKRMTELHTKAATAYKPLFYNNDFTYLTDPCNCELYCGDRLKQLTPCPCWKIDVGGEYRLRFHSENNFRTRPLSGTDDDFILHRTRIYADAKYGNSLKVYAEAIDATSDANNFSPRSIEVNRFDALNLFADVKLLPDSWFRGGRQELLYGVQRLVSPLDWANTRRTFDGAKGFHQGKDWDIDLFWTRPVPPGQHLPRDHNFDSPDLSQEFLGLYSTYKGRKDHTFDFYYLRLAEYDDSVTDELGRVGGFDVNTFGTRWQGKREDLLWEVEGGFQFGDRASSDTEAGFLTVGLGHTNSCHPNKPTIWVYYDWASGDSDPADGGNGTFNQLFPLAHKYLGFIDFFARQNIESVNVLGTWQLSDNVTFLAWYYVFWLDSSRDAVYNVAGQPTFRDPSGAAGHDLGNELDLLVQWQISPRADILFGYSHFWTGDYFRSPTVAPVGTATPVIPDDADFFYTQFTARF